MKYKKKYTIFIGVVVVLVITSVVGISTKLFIDTYKNNKKVKSVETKIDEGLYNEALEDLKDCEVNEVTERYSNILKDYIDYFNLEDTLDSLINYLSAYKEKYYNYLNEYPFNKLQNDVISMLDELGTKKAELESKVEDLKQLIENKDIDSSKALLNELLENYPKEDFTEVSELLASTEAFIEQERLKSLEQQEEEKKDNSSNSSSSANTSSDNPSSSLEDSSLDESSNNVQITQPSIANINAAKDSSQLITVVSKGGSYAELKLWQKNSNGEWYEYASEDARLGKNGVTDSKEEGDGCTPTGIYGLTEAFGSKGNPGTCLPYRTLDGSEYWVDDSNSQYYNTMQFGDPSGRWNSAEHLQSMGVAYNYAIVVDYNRWSPVAGKGSAIFLHVSTDGYTSGCISVSESMMVKTLNWINSESNPKIIITSSYDNLYKYY